MKVLLVDEDQQARGLLRGMLRECEGVEVVEAGSLAEAQHAVLEQAAPLMLVDVSLSGAASDREGLEFLRWVRARGSLAAVVMVTDSTDIAEIREAMRLGAQDYVLKDELCPEMLLPIVESFRDRLSQGETRGLRLRTESDWGTASLVGSSTAMQRVRRLIQRVATAGAPVLLRGETGTGKELAARAIHQLSARAEHPFLAVNCSALPGTLVESMIFGHQRGAFTGADRRVRGQLELAAEGTLLLDEIAEMPIELQAKLLRVLEDRRFRPLGSEVELPVRARILAATHVDLEQRMAQGLFREDLYYRLNVIVITLPPLRDHPADISELLRAFNSSLLAPLRFTPDALVWLENRDWPGNVRELKNAVERVALLCESHQVSDVDLVEIVGHSPRQRSRDLERLARAVLAMENRRESKLDVLERVMLSQALELCQGNKSAAARLMGVDRKALERRWSRLSEHPRRDGEA